MLKKKRRRAYWDSPVLDPNSLKIESLMGRWGDAPAQKPLPLISNGWVPLERNETATLLKLAASKIDQVALVLARPGFEMLGMAKRTLSFSDWLLYQLVFSENGKTGSLDLIASTKELRLLDGRNLVVYELIGKKVIRVDQDTAPEYTHFFINHLRGDNGRFQIIETVADLMWVDESAMPQDIDFHGLQTIESGEEDQSPRFEANILYHRSLFKAIFTTNLETGMVEMLEDRALTETPFCQEEMDGPLRFLAPPKPGNGRN